jgi:hypothetical protein
MRQFKILTAFALLCLLWLGQQAWSQSNCSYLTVSTGSYTPSQIDQAFAQADLDAYRFKTLRRSMKFSNGAEVQLYSAAELQTQGCTVNGAIAMDDNIVLDPARRFEILPGGVIYESVQAVYKH